MAVLSRQKVRFGPFELDTSSGELYKLGHKLNLRGQPIEVLSILLEHPGEVITREELCKRLWPEDTFVDFEHSLNAAIKKLRQALDYDPDAPRYIETLPKKGYRFIAQVETVGNGADPAVTPASSPPETPVDSNHAKQPPPPKPRHLKLAVVASTLVITIVTAGLYWLYRPRTPVVTDIHQLTRTGNHKSTLGGHHPVTDGTRVYFDEFTGGRWKLAQVSTKGGEVSYMEMPQPPSSRIADISHDGSELLMWDFDFEAVDSPAWVFSLPSGPARKIPGLRFLSLMSLPASKQIAYTQNSDPKRLFAAKTDGSEIHQLLVAPDNIDNFAVSPDGKNIRFSARDTMWESRLDGTGMHRLFPNRTEPMSSGQWSADGKLYAFVMWDGRAANLWADPESGLGPYHFVSQPVQLTYGPISFIWWSPGKDAKQIFALGETLHGELVVRDTESGEFRGYLNGISAGFVDFSRDGKWVTYVTYPEGTLWRSRMDGSERLQLTFPPMARIVNPKWSPDGRFIAFTEWKEPRSIYLVPADGGSPMLLLTGDCEPADPTWSPDGKSLLYGGQSILNGIEGGPPSEIRVLNLETKQSKTIPGSQHMFSPQWSPDGHYIAALSDGMTKVYLYSFNTALWKEVLLPAMPTPRNVSFPAWSRDSRYLYVLVKSDIYKFHVPDGRPELATTPIGFEVTCPIWRVGWFGLTPDDRIMVLRDRGTDELYALDLEYR